MYLNDKENGQLGWVQLIAAAIGAVGAAKAGKDAKKAQNEALDKQKKMQREADAAALKQAKIGAGAMSQKNKTYLILGGGALALAAVYLFTRRK